MGPEHAAEVAELHISGIGTGFISSLGSGFTTALYQGIAKSGDGFGFVALKDGKVIGFSSFTTNLGGLYKSVLLRSGLKFMFILAWRMFSFQRIKKVFETLFYPSRIKKLDLPSAEFLSMSISEAGRGKGLATRLMQKGFDECSSRGIDKIKIFAAVDIVGINKMYEKYGFDLACQMENHGVVSNVYVAETGKNYVERKYL
jgi:ribosomal protein S18 acetylase RimI-like enzyme